MFVELARTALERFEEARRDAGLRRAEEHGWDPTVDAMRKLIQEKLARMEVARLNVQNLVFRNIEMSAAGRGLTLAEASAMKLYSARAATEVAMEAVQLHGGNGYMAEFHVEQLARDAKVLQIYAGTDEIQITHIAKDLLRR